MECDEATAIPASPPLPGSRPAPDLPGTLRAVLCHYSRFVREFLARPDAAPPYHLLLLWLTGAAMVADRLELKSEAFRSVLSTWPLFWLTVLLGGALLAWLPYFVQGGIYHLRLRMSGGQCAYRISCCLWLYSGLPLTLMIIGHALLKQLVLNQPPLRDGPSPTLLILIASIAVAVAYSITLSYRGVRQVPGVHRAGALVLFVILPALGYLILGSSFLLKGVATASSAVRLNNAALQLFNAGEYARAVPGFAAALQAAQDQSELRATILGNLGATHEHLGHKDQAASCYRQAAAQLPPGSCAALVAAADVLLLEHRTGEALVQLKQALALAPDDFKVNNELGVICMGEYDDAYQDYAAALTYNRKAWQLNPSPATARLLLATYYHVGDYSNTVALGRQLLATNPQDPNALFFTGLGHYHLGHASLARPNLEQAARLKPDLHTEYIARLLAELQGAGATNPATPAPAPTAPR